MQLTASQPSPRFGQSFLFKIAAPGTLVPYTDKKALDDILSNLKTAVPDAYSKITLGGASPLYLAIACFDKDDAAVIKTLGRYKPLASTCQTLLSEIESKNIPFWPITNQPEFDQAKKQIDRYNSPSAECWSNNDNKSAKLNTVV